MGFVEAGWCWIGLSEARNVQHADWKFCDCQANAAASRLTFTRASMTAVMKSHGLSIVASALTSRTPRSSASSQHCEVLCPVGSGSGFHMSAPPGSRGSRLSFPPRSISRARSVAVCGGGTHVLSEIDFARLSLSDRLSGLAKAKVAGGIRSWPLHHGARCETVRIRS